MNVGVIIVIIILVVLFIVTLAKSITVIHQAQKGLIERFGRYKETLEPGLRFIIPFIDKLAARVDMRETVLDVEPQAVITKDNVGVTVDAVVYYYVTDAKSVRYEVANFYVAVSKLAQTNLRNLVGDMSLDETLASRERINSALRTTLDEATDKWGVKVTRVEVKAIEPPRDITDAMSKQMKAEREKRATILEAEAYRQKQILMAEGDKQNAILVAEGARQSAILRAEGEAKAIENVSTAADKYFVGNAQLLKQLEVTQAALQNNSKLVISDQSKLVNVLGLAEALSQVKPAGKKAD
ncbi:MAG TPA: SPFH domain-containing protein [Dehalococcoidales bacterium]|nr:SPFH domain-containing protein [Dehalococcoidales bacterium]